MDAVRKSYNFSMSELPKLTPKENMELIKKVDSTASIIKNTTVVAGSACIIGAAFLISSGIISGGLIPAAIGATLLAGREIYKRKTDVKRENFVTEAAMNIFKKGSLQDLHQLKVSKSLINRCVGTKKITSDQALKIIDLMDKFSFAHALKREINRVIVDQAIKKGYIVDRKTINLDQSSPYTAEFEKDMLELEAEWKSFQGY